MTVERFFAHSPMASLFSGSLVEDETVALICPEEEKRLLYRIDRILSVRSYDGETLYTPGRDYILTDGRLRLTPGSAIPVMTPELYYSEGAQPILRVRKPDGTESPCFFSEDGTIARYQVRVTYTHKDAWAGFRQPHRPGACARFLTLLAEGKDAAVLFYGDSITYGANASFLQQSRPFQPPYPMLFTEALAELYGHTVRFVPPGAEGAFAGPPPALHTGGRGTLTYVNTAVGSWNAAQGAERLDTHLAPQIEAHGCDLFVWAFGMNDGNRTPEAIARDCETAVRRVRALCPRADVLLISTMSPNPQAVNGWMGSHPRQEAALLRLAEKLRAEGIPCEVAQMYSVSAAVLERKSFFDYTGNNINHPNDFFSRVYAQTLLETAVGYETGIG